MLVSSLFIKIINLDEKIGGIGGQDIIKIINPCPPVSISKLEIFYNKNDCHDFLHNIVLL